MPEEQMQLEASPEVSEEKSRDGVPTKITSLGQLKQEARFGAEFFVLLKHNLKSSKWILWDEKAQVFIVRNHIDQSEQVLTEEQILDASHTNVGVAMSRKALFKADY